MECGDDCAAKSAAAAARKVPKEKPVVDDVPRSGSDKAEGVEAASAPVEQRGRHKARKEEARVRRAAAADAAAAAARSHRTLASLSKAMARPEAVGALVFLALAVMLAIVRAQM